MSDEDQNIALPLSTNLYGSSEDGTTAALETVASTAGQNLTVAFPSVPSLTPVEVQLHRGRTKFQEQPATFERPFEDVEGMIGRSTKVYAASDSATASLEQFRLGSTSRQSSEGPAMDDPPPQPEIGMSNLSPRHDVDRQDPSDTLNRTLHQVIYEL